MPNENLEKYETFQLNLKVSQFSGYSNVYTSAVMDKIETMVRKELDDSLGFLDDVAKRNYSIERIDP